MVSGRFSLSEGSPEPLGVTLSDEGINVAVVSRHASAVHVSLFEGDTETVRFALAQRLGDIHFGLIAGVKAGQKYGLRADGPFDPGAGHLFDSNKLLADPYAAAIDRAVSWHPELAQHGAETAHLVPKCIVREPLSDAVRLPSKRPEFIYEIAVKAFSRLHPAIPEKDRGTVAALRHPAAIDHLTKLGVDTVELMPLMAWIDERHLPPLGLANAWGYNPVSFFAPDPRLAPGGLPEIRAAVAALHQAGIRTVLDVVFNHTGESDLGGPTLSLRGLDNALYYRHAEGRLVNDTGCGNTLALDQYPAMRLVIDAMRHWVRTTGIDGFRYDLATVMGRTPRGFESDAALLSAIRQDPMLGPLIHIVEPWDVGPQGYRLGEFPPAWLEWNDRYRDDVRRFWRGDPGAQGALATRLAGSSDVFAATHRRPSCGVNFVAAHDGFTLADAVAYERKYNFANGEGNRDGNDHEISWKAREPAQDVRALLASLFLSRGTPMLTAGDEFGRGQNGNNNAYAQDNETTWLDWKRADRELETFVSQLASFRMKHRALFADRFLNGHSERGQIYPDAEWFAAGGRKMTAERWNDRDLAALGLVLFDGGSGRRVLIWINRAAEGTAVRFTEPQAGTSWLATPDFPAPRVACSANEAVLAGRSISVFMETDEKTAGRSTGIEDALVQRLATLAGIQSEWWEVSGSHHIVSPETKRTLLSAMGIDISSASSAIEDFKRLEAPGLLPKIHIARPDVPAAIPLNPDSSCGSVKQRFYLSDESGTCIAIDHPAGRSALSLPRLKAGYYDLAPDDETGIRCRLMVAPEGCYLPHEIAEGQRFRGLSAHLYSLRDSRDAGIGDFETLARFCGITAKLGGDAVGISPLHHLFPDDRTRVSPYQPSDRRFIDPIYIDLTGLARGLVLTGTKGRLNALNEALALLRRLSHVDYGAVWRLKDDVLREAFREFEKKGANQSFEQFIVLGGDALARHAEFESRGAAQDQRYHMWLQWAADKQLAAAARRAGEEGLRFGIYRDLAVGCAYEGGEVHARPAVFATEISLGAPPDPFAQEGQIWNLPPHNPLALETAGFAPFVEVLAANMRHAGVLRVDHILGFARQFWVPRGASGTDGAYVSVNTEALIAATAIESHRARCMVIGEDLGTVPEGLRQRLAEAAILSYRMLWFEQDAQGFKRPSDYPRMSAACLSSHDLAPFKGWRQSSSQEDIRKLETAIARESLSTGDLLADAHAFVASAPSAVMLIQADDLSEETEPLNVPGTDKEYPNWRRRLSVDVDALPDLPPTQRVIAVVDKARPRPPARPRPMR
jgi:glycogen operon protein